MLKLVLRTALLSSVAMLGATAAAKAADFYVPPVVVPPPAPTPWFDKTFGATITSDYVARGFSQTNGGPAVQAFFEISTGIFYAGVWASNVYYPPANPGVEFDLYAGIRTSAGPLSLDLGYVHYLYSNQAATATGELYAKASVAVWDPLTLGAAVYWNPYTSQVYTEANAAITFSILPAPWSSKISAAVGYQTVAGPGDYWTWNIGKTLTYADTISLDLRYHDTNISGPLYTVSLGFSTSLSKLSGWSAAY